MTSKLMFTRVQSVLPGAGEPYSGEQPTPLYLNRMQSQMRSVLFPTECAILLPFSC